MQTFLPYPDFKQSAEVLDYRRLGKQRLEARQIINILDGTAKGTGWKNHPVTKMWTGYLISLKHYFNCISREWINRGYKHNMGLYIIDVDRSEDFIIHPNWLGDPDFHKSHQSNLIRKFPEHYSQYFQDVPNDLPYIWPKSNKIL